MPLPPPKRGTASAQSHALSILSPALEGSRAPSADRVLEKSMPPVLQKALQVSANAEGRPQASSKGGRGLKKVPHRSKALGLWWGMSDVFKAQRGEGDNLQVT